jgi:hypothetical protein
VIPTRVEQLTRAFYEWEIRGRGWEHCLYTTRLEPPFEPFAGHRLERPPVDDGRHHTWLSALAERLAVRGTPTALPEQPEDAEPTATEPWDAPELDEYLVTIPPDARANRAACSCGSSPS